MTRERFSLLLDRAGIGVILLGAALLRTDLDYRTAFVDEAINLFKGWQMFHGQESYALTTHMGWPPLSMGPVGLAGWWGDLAVARGLTAVFGVVTVLFVMLTARWLYGQAAGFIAGGLSAVYGPAIFISTFAHQDSQSVMLVSIALYFWARALAEDRKELYAAGSLFLTLGVLTKYAAVVLAGGAVVYGIALAVGAVGRPRSADSEGRVWGRVVRNLVWAGAPFLLLVVYLLVYREALSAAWQGQVLTKSSSDPYVRWLIGKDLVEYLWLPLLLGLVALFRPGRRVQGIGLFWLGLTVLLYQLANNDEGTFFKHTGYMMVSWAPLAAGGLCVVGEVLAGSARLRWRPAVWSAILGLGVVAYVAVAGQMMLPGLRSYWSDTRELMAFLRGRVEEGDSILMETGMVGKYYLIEKGTPGHIPADILDTWWYEDEEGEGEDAFKRAIVGRRFDYVIFDHASTPELNQELAALMSGRYELLISFPAYRFESEGQIDVFRAVE